MSGGEGEMNKYINPDIRCTLDPDTDGYCWSYKQYIDKGEEFLKLETVKRCKQIKTMQDICLRCVYWANISNGSIINEKI